MTKHTNLPWRAARGGYIMAADENSEVVVGKIGAFHDKEMAPFNRERWQADLELIVKACNALPDLVKALEAFAIHATYPVSTEINTRGYEWRGQEALDYAKGLADAVLTSVKGASK
jgi:hypothetical protein